MRNRQYALTAAGILAGILVLVGLATAGATPPQGYRTVTTLTASPGSFQITSGEETLYLRAVLTNGRAPLPTVGATITFTATSRIRQHLGQPPLTLCSAVTDGAGVAQCHAAFFHTVLSGVTTYTASFAGNDDLAPSSGSAPLVRLHG